MPNPITRKLAYSDDPRSLSARSRLKRWGKFAECFPQLDQMKVLDLGGTTSYWREAPVAPAHVTVVNMSKETSRIAWLKPVQADACTFSAQERFDLVVSNSLIEHVGGHFRRQQLADVVRAHSARYWIQTPYRYFPVEPHWVAPAFQWLPAAARARYSKAWPVGHFANSSPERVLGDVLDIELLSKIEMRYYFPEALLWSERLMGITKSLVAINA
jgi:hypothetical protein